MARTKAEDEAKRTEITRSRADRIAIVFDCHKGGISRAQLAEEAEVPEQSLGYLMVWMRKNATEVERLATCLQIGGEWIYGWAHVLDDHLREHHKRRTNEARSLVVSIESLTQSCLEQPDSFALRRQLASAKGRLGEVELEVEEAAGLIRSLRSVTSS